MGESGNDSFEAFEEVLELAGGARRGLHPPRGGDLFHEKTGRPRHCQCALHGPAAPNTPFGDRAVNFNILSDPAINFPHTKQVNYLDPNLNVAIPVVSSHPRQPPMNPAGNTKLAVYGMSSVKDEDSTASLWRTRSRCCVPRISHHRMVFNLMVAASEPGPQRGTSNYLPDPFLDPFLGLIFGGHGKDLW
ncbi:Double-strand break repair protein MRE11 [Chionoecetes opilio]|uniref:Double-strand break repair protein MRE11 n=1 Tax=Chionoecetes opilio TaxID=41210 RepID=A0A8J4YJF7_CHIOP|nr:Double-strand break repair protein MRE11 [Chionoecetes opilio]